MEFRSRQDGTHHPISDRSGSIPAQAFEELAEQDKKRTPRSVSKKERARLRTLENDLLYQNFVKKIQKLNPDFDPDLIDRSLEVEEALMDLKRKHPEIDIGLKDDEAAGFREFLSDMGITNEKVQNMVAMEDNPLSEEELAQLAHVLNNRSDKAVKTDKALKARKPKSIREYIKDPDRTDVPGIDSPE